ncbi:zinc finger protein 75A-like [Salarias fasciatus]|uniref:Zinc finger protein 75A-like n=1 Tax=Salarias fasciatus TaxID=181472 RepID=A0A672GW64_SALFA|nr:zinc finger protein 75A-like [Salarias fasciatus]
MSSVQALREFINERLTAAAVEIFTVFEQTVVRYEEQIDQQIELLEISCKHQITFNRTESPQRQNQKTTSRLELEEHEAPHMKDASFTDGDLDSVRDLIIRRLTAAAVEIFSVFQQTVVRCKKEIDRQHRMLGNIWKPKFKLRGTEFPQHQDCREEQLFEQETNYCANQGEPEPPQIKEEQEEPGFLEFKEEQEEPELLQIKEEEEEPGLLQFKEEQDQSEPEIENHEEVGTSQEEEQLILKFESESLRIPSIEEKRYLSEPEEEPNTEPFLPHDSNIQQTDSESTTNVELKKILFRGERVEKFPVSETQAEFEVLLCDETYGENVRKKRKVRQKLGPDTNTAQIICEICGKSYAQQRNLFRHMKTHTGEKPYSCETCEKSFTEHSSLLRHMKTHTGEKPYPCEMCGKSFSQQNHMLIHMRIHTGEKPYRCVTCGKSFSQHNHMLGHMRIHTGERPYSCETCGRSFSDNSNLLRHVKAHKLTDR